MAKEFFSGRNLQQAILAAARRFALDPEDVAYTERGRSGGFIKNPKVVIEVDSSSPRRSAPPAAAAPAELAPLRSTAPQPRTALPDRRRETRTRRDAPTAPQGDPRAAQGAAASAATLLARLAGLDVEPSVSVADEANELHVDLVGPDAGASAASGGELLEAMEHLTPRLLRGLGSDPVFCRVDAAGFRASREAALRAMALEAAEAVRREGRPHALPELPPAERRIVHLTLEADPAVRTESHGEGFRKSVTVRPA